jgi:hypothetical protein
VRDKHVTFVFGKGRVFTEEQKRKYDYVRTVLTVVLREVLGNDHYMMEYFVDDHGDEWVDITFGNEYNVRKVNVTADSLLALTKDVLKTF